MGTAALWFVALVLYLFLGYGAHTLIDAVERRKDETPPEMWLCMVLWPVILAVVAWLRIDGRDQ